MSFIVYSKPNCPYCFQIKTVLELCGQKYKILTLDEDFTRENFYSEFGEGSTFPQVIFDNRHLGGCTETISYLKSISLI